jgi:hypothetical protein
MPHDSRYDTPEQYAAYTGKMSYPAGQAKSDVAKAVKNAFLPLKPLVEKYESHWDRATREATDKLEAKMWEVPSQGESMSEPELIGPKPCYYCGGEYGEHREPCAKNKGMSESRKHCRACGKLLCDDSVADGCPCNGPVGCNHGLVPSRTCLCDICDPERTGCVRPYQPSMSEFKFGQTVWRHLKQYEVIHQYLKDVWVKDGTHGEILPVEWLTATDPNAKPLPPEPQKCPFCGYCPGFREIHAQERHWVGCENFGCRFLGPERPTREEAIAAWNSLRVIQPGEFTGDLREALRKAADDCKFKIDDHDAIETSAEKHGIPWPDNYPLGEEWLRKVGLGGPDGGLSTGSTLGNLFISDYGVVGFVRKGSSSIFLAGQTVKTIGDARQLCRLLSVPLKESQQPVNPLAHAQEVYQGILEDYKKSREPFKE